MALWVVHQFGSQLMLISKEKLILLQHLQESKVNISFRYAILDCIAKPQVSTFLHHIIDLQLFTRLLACGAFRLRLLFTSGNSQSQQIWVDASILIYISAHSRPHCNCWHLVPKSPWQSTHPSQKISFSHSRGDFTPAHKKSPRG